MKSPLLLTTFLAALLPHLASTAAAAVLPCAHATSATGIPLISCPGDPDPYITQKLVHELTQQKADLDQARKLQTASSSSSSARGRVFRG
jgi:hypothetical protein